MANNGERVWQPARTEGTSISGVTIWRLNSGLSPEERVEIVLGRKMDAYRDALGASVAELIEPAVRARLER